MFINLNGRPIYMEADNGAQGGGSGSGNEGGQSQADNNGGQSQAGGQQQQDGAQQTNAEDLASLPDWAQRQIKDLRTESGRYRTENKTLTKFKEDTEAATLTEAQKLQRQAEDAGKTAQALKERVVKSEVKLAAKDANIIDPDAAYALLDKSAIEYDDAGEPKNIGELLEALVKDKPYLVGQAQNTVINGGNPANPNRTQKGAVTFTTTQISDPKFWAANKEAIMAASRDGRIIEG